jgi:hypothetical protein
MIRLVHVTLLIVFLASAATMVVLRSPGENTVAEGGRYFGRHKQLRYEVSREYYEENQRSAWRAAASRGAAVTMFASLFSFAGLESVRFRRRRRPTARDPLPRERRLRDGGRH